MKLFSYSILTATLEFLMFSLTQKSYFKPSHPLTQLQILVKYSKNYWKCQKTRSEVPEKCHVVFSFSNLDTEWQNYKNLPIFFQGNKKFTFVLQYNKLRT